MAPITVAVSVLHRARPDTAGEQGGRFAFVGSVAMIMMLSAVVGVSDLPAGEKWRGTYFRLRMSGIAPPVTFALRALPWAMQALISATPCVAIVGPLTGNADLTVGMLPMLPVIGLMAISSTAAGLASPAIGRRADVLFTNAFVYLVIATGGLLVPAGRLPILDAVGSVLPLRHGVLAVRAHLDKLPWLPEATLEALVAVAWAVAAAVLYRRQARRAAMHGLDDYA